MIIFIKILIYSAVNIHFYQFTAKLNMVFLSIFQEKDNLFSKVVNYSSKLSTTSGKDTIQEKQELRENHSTFARVRKKVPQKAFNLWQG